MSDKKEKLTVTLGDEEIEILYKIFREYFFVSDFDTDKAEEFYKLEWLYDEILAALKRINPDRFKGMEWDDDLPF